MEEILIKNMKMPKDMSKPLHISIFSNGSVWITHEGKTEATAQELLSHGRLIDADFFKEYAIRVSTEDGKEYIPSNYVDIVPTILEASK